MAVSAPALTTLTNLKSALQIASADTTYDTLLEKDIDRATDEIERRTGRLLKARNYNGYGTAFEHKTTSTGDTATSEDYLYFDGGKAVKDQDGYSAVYLP